MAKRNPSKPVQPPQPATTRGATSERPRGPTAGARSACVQQRRAERRKRLLTLGGVGGLALLVVLAFIIYSSRSDTVSASNEPITVPTLYGDTVPMNGTTIGDPNATVVLQEWGDYQCPGCGQFARTSEQQIIDEYVKTGKIRFEFHDFPFLDQQASGNESHHAAEAAPLRRRSGQVLGISPHAVLQSGRQRELGRLRQQAPDRRRTALVWTEPVHELPQQRHAHG